VYSYQKSCVCSDSVRACFKSPSVDFNMTIEVINASKPVRHGWEAFFKYVDPVTGVTYYGQQGSIVRIRNTEVIYTSDLVNTDPLAEENQCERCKHPSPKPKAPPATPEATPPPVLHRILGASSNESDGGAGAGPGSGSGKPKRPPLHFPFALFDGEGDGWYKGGNATDEVCAGVAESVMPSVITYPRYSIVSGDRTTLIHEGTICGAFSTEACEEVLPYDGRFVFRVAGYSQDPSKVRWDFCGESGILGEELQFKMVKGKCVAVEKRTAEDYCQGIESISVWSGSLLLSGASSFSSLSVSMGDSRVLERTLSELLFHSEVHIDSLVVGEDGLTVAFSSTIVLEQLGYVGVYPDEVEVAEEFIETSMANAMATGVALASFQNLLYQDPSLSSGVIGQTTSVSLLGFEMTSLSYRTKTSSASNGNSNGDNNDPGDDAADSENNNKAKDEEGEKTAVDELTHFSLVGYVSGGIALVFVAVLFVVIGTQSRDPIPPQDLPTSVLERSDHSLLDRNEKASKYADDEVFRFR
jgi:hypothetical protein